MRPQQSKNKHAMYTHVNCKFLLFILYMHAIFLFSFLFMYSYIDYWGFQYDDEFGEKRRRRRSEFNVTYRKKVGEIPFCFMCNGSSCGNPMWYQIPDSWYWIFIAIASPAHTHTHKLLSPAHIHFQFHLIGISRKANNTIRMAPASFSVWLCSVEHKPFFEIECRRVVVVAVGIWRKKASPCSKWLYQMKLNGKSKGNFLRFPSSRLIVLSDMKNQPYLTCFLLKWPIFIAHHSQHWISNSWDSASGIFFSIVVISKFLTLNFQIFSFK
jgi:hypothetical protein